MLIAFSILVILAFYLAEKAQANFLVTLFFMVTGSLVLVDVMLR